MVQLVVLFHDPKKFSLGHLVAPDNFYCVFVYRGGRGRPRDGSGGGPMRTRSGGYDSYDRRPDYGDHSHR